MRRTVIGSRTTAREGFAPPAWSQADFDAWLRKDQPRDPGGQFSGGSLEDRHAAIKGHVAGVNETLASLTEHIAASDYTSAQTAAQKLASRAIGLQNSAEGLVGFLNLPPDVVAETETSGIVAPALPAATYEERGEWLADIALARLRPQP